MAVQQLLSLIIQATDRASAVVDKITGKIGGIGDSANNAQAKTDNLSNAIAFGMVKAQAAIAVVSSGVDFLKGKIQEAASIELENLSAASGLDSMLGGFDKAADFVDNLNASLAKAAAALPGATADYTSLARAITDDVAAAFKDANGKITNLSGYETTLKSIATSYAAMGAASGVAAGNTQLFLMKALSGTSSMGELQQIDALQKNAQLRTRLQAALDKQGVKDLKQLTAEQRIKLLDEVGKQVITPDFLKRSQNTVEGLTQSFLSSLFDPMTGLFGLNRDLDERTKGVQSTFTAIRDTLNTLIGSGGLLDNIGGLLADLGLTVDPMQLLRDGVLAANRFLISLNDLITYLRDPQRKTQSIIDGLEQVFSGFDLGGLLATANEAVRYGLYRLGEWVDGAFRWLSDYLGQLSPDAGAKLGSDLGLFVGRLINDLVNFVVHLDWGAILVTIGRLAIQLIGAVGGFILGLRQPIVEGADQRFEEFKQALLQGLSDLWSALVQWVADGLSNLKNSALSTLQSAASNPVSAVTAAANAPASIAGAVVNNAINPIGAIAGLFGAKASGYIPNAATGFFPLGDAISREMRAKPANAGLVVANTSEAILTPSMLKNLVSGAVGAGASANGGTFSPSIVIQAAQDPEATAKEVLRYLEIFYQEYQQGQLA